MFLEEFSLNTANMFAPPQTVCQEAPRLPEPRSLIGGGASLFLASDLFPACSLRRRLRVERAPLNTLAPGQTALFSGEGLDQFDQDVFIACLLSGVRGQKPVRRSLRELLRVMGRRQTPEQLGRLEASLFRLGSARLELTDQRFGCCIQLVESVLLDRESGVCRVQASREVISVFRHGEDLESLARLRFSLGTRPLTKWLAGLVFALGGDNCLLDLERLRVLCGRGKIPARVFAGQALPALSTLVDMGYIQSAVQCEEGRVMIAGRPGRPGQLKPNECQLVW